MFSRKWIAPRHDVVLTAAAAAVLTAAVPAGGIHLHVPVHHSRHCSGAHVCYAGFARKQEQCHGTHTHEKEILDVLHFLLVQGHVNVHTNSPLRGLLSGGSSWAGRGNGGGFALVVVLFVPVPVLVALVPSMLTSSMYLLASAFMTVYTIFHIIYGIVRIQELHNVSILPCLTFDGMTLSDCGRGTAPPQQCK